MTDRSYLALVMLLLTGLMLMAIAGHHAWTGPELFPVSHSHGVNLGDLPVVAGWAVGIFACWRLWPGRDE